MLFVAVCTNLRKTKHCCFACKLLLCMLCGPHFLVQYCTSRDHRLGCYTDSGSSLIIFTARWIQHFLRSSTCFDDFHLQLLSSFAYSRWALSEKYFFSMFATNKGEMRVGCKVQTQNPHPQESTWKILVHRRPDMMGFMRAATTTSVKTKLARRQKNIFTFPTRRPQRGWFHDYGCYPPPHGTSRFLSA